MKGSEGALSFADVQRISPEEWRLRKELAAAYRLIALYGWDDLIATHLSVRLPDENGERMYLINPLGMMFEEITASCLIKVNLKGEMQHDSPFELNEPGLTIHGGLYEARPDAGSIMHLHTLDGVAVSMMEEGLLPLNQTAMLVAEHVAYHEYEGIADEEEEKARMAADLGDKPLMILRNHGTLSINSSISRTFMLLFFLEWSCSVQVRAFTAGKSIHFAPQAVVNEVGKFLTEGDLLRFAELAWPALLRKAERDSPGFAE